MKKITKNRREFFYSWVNTTTGERLGWVFPSRKKAKEWYDEFYWRYPKYERLDDYLATIKTIPAKKFSRRYWYRDKRVYENYKLTCGVLIYPGTYADGRPKTFEVVYVNRRLGVKKEVDGDNRREIRQPSSNIPADMEEQICIHGVDAGRDQAEPMEQASDQTGIHPKEQGEDS